MKIPCKIYTGERPCIPPMAMAELRKRLWKGKPWTVMVSKEHFKHLTPEAMKERELKHLEHLQGHQQLS